MAKIKVQLLVSRAGPDFVQNAGDVIEVDADEGKRMVDAGQCTIVRASAREKTAKL